MGIKTKIKTIEPKTYQGKVTGYLLVLENGIQGYLNDKGSDSGLSAGSDVEYTLEVKKNKKTGADYNLLTVKFAQALTTGTPTPSPAPPPTKGTNTPYSPSVEQFKAKASFEAMRFVIDTLIADKITWDQLKEKHIEVTQFIIDGVNVCLQE